MRGPLLCAKCNRPATKIIPVVINGKNYDMPLCDDCARIYEHQSPSVFDTINSMELTCPLCGTSISEVIESQYLGCSKCYDVFRDEVLAKINDMHGTRKHIGKRLPKARVTKNIVLADAESMREQYHLAREEGRDDDAEEILEYLRRMTK